MSKKIPILGLAIVLFSCAGNGVKGTTHQWVKGKALSINVVFVRSGANGGAEPVRPLIRIRGDSGRPILISPVTVTAWFAKAGKVPSRSAFGQFDRTEAVESAQFEVRKQDGSVREVTIDKKNQELSLLPQEEVLLSPSLWQFAVDAFDDLERVQISIGRKGSEEREVFIVVRERSADSSNVNGPAAVNGSHSFGPKSLGYRGYLPPKGKEEIQAYRDMGLGLEVFDPSSGESLGTALYIGDAYGLQIVGYDLKVGIGNNLVTSYEEYETGQRVHAIYRIVKNGDGD